jgi:hypothetical protein
MSLDGIIIGFASLMVIGLFHPLVIRGEYHFGIKIWPLFLVLGIGLCVASVFIKNTVAGGVCGITGFCSFWSIHELFLQRKRVERGWFPRKDAGHGGEDD